MSRKFNNLILLLLAGFSLVLYQNCGPSDGTDTGDPGVQLQLDSYSQSTAWHNLFLPKALADVSGVSMCIHQVRFKADNSSDTPGTNIVIDVDYVEWSPGGTSLGNIQIASGDYRRIDIMVKNECGDGTSLRVQNDSGLFSGSQPLTLRFIGEISVDKNTDVISLGVESFINFFDTVTSDNDLRAGVETIDGSL